MVNVDILENERQGQTLTSRVVVSHEQPQSVDYTVRVGLVDGPSDTISGTLPSSTGSFPGGSDTEMVEFDLGGMDEGTVYAELVSGGSDRTELSFGGEDGGYYPTDPEEGFDAEQVALILGGAVGVGLVARRLL